MQKAYIALLNEELDRVNQFYEEKEAELIKQFNQLKSILAESWDGNSEIPRYHCCLLTCFQIEIVLCFVWFHIYINTRFILLK